MIGTKAHSRKRVSELKLTILTYTLKKQREPTTTTTKRTTLFNIYFCENVKCSFYKMSETFLEQSKKYAVVQYVKY